MNFDIDTAIFVVFLVVNLAVGLFYSRGIKNIREYAIGDRNFSTATIAATILATWIGAGVFSMNVTGSYTEGLYYIIPALGNGLMFIIIGAFLAVRMSEFLGALSIAEVMGNLYGKHVRLITSLMSIFFCIGTVAIQFKVSANILQLFFNISSFYAIVIASVIVTVYSTWGGIKSVTFTDLIQIFMFGSIIPIISLIIWGTISDPGQIFESLNNDPLFDFNQVLSYNNPKFFLLVSLFFVFLFPELDPAVFQRILLARNIAQVSRSFIIAGVLCLMILLMLFWMGSLLRVSNPNLDPNTIVNHIISEYGYVGLKGLIGAGIMAAIMSTADSYANSAAIIFAHDIGKALGIKWIEARELLISRCFSIFIGVSCFYLASQKGVLELMVLTWSFYMPIVSVPLILAIFGFRTSARPVLIGMASGIVTVVIWRIYFLDLADSVIPGILVHFIALIISHYLLGEPGGWVGIKNPEPLIALRNERKRKIQSCIKVIKEFNLWSFCKKNTPIHDYIYSLFGFFCIISVFSSMYSIPKNIQLEHKEILEFVYHTVLVSSSILLTFPIWPLTFKQEKFIIIAWNIMLPYILVFAPTLLIIVSNFGQFQLMIFMLNIIIIAIMLRWQVAIFMVCCTVFLGVQSYKWYVGVDDLSAAVSIGLQFKIMYVLLLVSSILIVFLKPKQQHQDLTEEKNEYLNGRMGEKEKEAQEALALKAEFIRNISHEYHAPMTGVISMSEALLESYDKLNDQQRLSAIKTIFNSSHSLKTFDNNIVTLARLNKPHYELKKENLDFSSLVYDRIQTCRKLYEENNEDREFVLDIEEGIVINADKGYVVQLLDNLIINSMSYCKKGIIRVALSQDKNNIHLVISDTGIGIPKNELSEIFEPFMVSSRTKTPAGGRGVGLSICKRILEVHGGSIKAESDGEKGSSFVVMLTTDV
jgi:Na+/proline symporter/signal transduction histidine kinase